MDNADEKFMRRALELARRGWGKTAPNPMVGAVMVKDGRIVGEGWHTRDGAAHAEIECLRAAVESPQGSTLYVTLEPCSTRGRTGACCDAIIAAGIASVKIGSLDPNPAHCGAALKIFAAKNIACEHGILAANCRALNYIFNYSIVNRKALLALKYAVSADLKIAAQAGKPYKITNAHARENLMQQRALYGAIGVGVGTLIADNPSLTARQASGTTCGLRLIFDASLKLADCENLKKYKVFADEFAAKTRVVCDSAASGERQKKLEDSGIRTMRIPCGHKTAEFWDALKTSLYDERITSVMIEGGASVIASVCAARAAEYAFEYQNPQLTIGDRGLGAFDLCPDRKKPFSIDGEKIALDGDTLLCGEAHFL